MKQKFIDFNNLWIMIAWTMICVIVSVFAAHRNFEESKFYDKVFSGFNEKCNLISEQRVSCYRGCQHAEQYLRNEKDAIASFTIPTYEYCTDLCESRFHVDYAEDGNTYIKCNYNESNIGFKD